MVGPLTAAIQESFQKKIRKSDGCWLWTGYKNKVGYGYFSYGEYGVRRFVRSLAHRFAYELVFGAIPKDKDVHHRCDNKSCVKPEHLELVNRKEHPGGGAEKQRLKTHCPNGHEYNEENTYTYTDYRGRKARQCRRCWSMKNELKQLALQRD